MLQKGVDQRILRGTMLRDSTPKSKVILHNLQVAFKIHVIFKGTHAAEK